MGPIDQFKIISYSMIGSLPFTNSALAMGLASYFAGLFLAFWSKFSDKIKLLRELYFQFIEGLMLQGLGHVHEFMVPLISSIFLFLLFGNLFGLIPGMFTFTSHLLPNAIIASIVIFGVIIIGFARNGVEFLHIFAPKSVPLVLLPIITPIELITFFMRIVSLSMRLCINMCVGHMILKIFLNLSLKFGPCGPLIGILYIPFLAMETAVCVLQAYIFTLLSCIYLKDAVESTH